MVNNILDEKKRHVKSLEKLCMICCQKIVKSKGYINPKNVSSNSEVLKELFSISVNKEKWKGKLYFYWRFDICKFY